MPELCECTRNFISSRSSWNSSITHFINTNRSKARSRSKAIKSRSSWTSHKASRQLSLFTHKQGRIWVWNNGCYWVKCRPLGKRVLGKWALDLGSGRRSSGSRSLYTDASGTTESPLLNLLAWRCLRPNYWTMYPGVKDQDGNGDYFQPTDWNE